MIAAHGRQIRHADELSVIGRVEEDVSRLDDLPRIRVPRRMAPFLAHEHGLPSGEIIDHGALTVTGILRTEIVCRAIGPRRGHLEEYTGAVGRDHREEYRSRASAELALQPFPVALFYVSDRHDGPDFAGGRIQQLQVAMRAGIPMTAIKRKEIIDRASEAKLAILREAPVLQRVEIDDVHTPASVLHIMIRDALAAADPLLAGAAVRILGVDVARNDRLFAGGAIAHDELSAVPVRRGGNEVEHTRAIRTFRVGQVVCVQDVATSTFSDGPDSSLRPDIDRSARVHDG